VPVMREIERLCPRNEMAPDSDHSEQSNLSLTAPFDR
jgi:hypothetical protein